MRIGWFFIVMFGTGCSGSGGSGAVSAGLSFQAELEALNRLPVTTIVDLPPSGTVNYVGNVQLRLPIAGQATDYKGDLHVAFDFDRPTDFVTGQIGHLQHNGSILSGRLDLSNGTLDRTAEPDRDYQFSADLAGLFIEGGVEYRTSGEIYGDFRDVGSATTTGVLAGTLSSDEDGLVLFDGAFFARKDHEP